MGYLGRSDDDRADIDGTHAKKSGELARELAKKTDPLPQPVGRANALPHRDIPDVEGAPTGITGIKAPFSYRQEGDIRDRLQAAVVKPIPFVIK